MGDSTAAEKNKGSNVIIIIVKDELNFVLFFFCSWLLPFALRGKGGNINMNLLFLVG